MNREEQERQENLRMMKDTLSWARWPPMKRVGGKDRPLLGFLLATGKPKLYLRNFLDLSDIGIQTVKEVDEKVPANEYASFEDILNDGWIVD